MRPSNENLRTQSTLSKLLSTAAMGALFAGAPLNAANAFDDLDAALADLSAVAAEDLTQVRGGASTSSGFINFGLNLSITTTISQAGAVTPVVVVTTNFTMTSLGDLQNLGTTIANNVNSQLAQAGLVDDGNDATQSLGQQISHQVADNVGVTQKPPAAETTSLANVAPSAPSLAPVDAGRTAPSDLAVTSPDLSGGALASTDNLLGDTGLSVAGLADTGLVGTLPGIEAAPIGAVLASDLASNLAQGAEVLGTQGTPDLVSLANAAPDYSAQADLASNSSGGLVDLVAETLVVGAGDLTNGLSDIASVGDELTNGVDRLVDTAGLGAATGTGIDQLAADNGLVAALADAAGTIDIGGATQVGTIVPNNSVIENTIAEPAPAAPQQSLYVASFDAATGDLVITDNTGTSLVQNFSNGGVSTVINNTKNNYVFLNQVSANISVNREDQAAASTYNQALDQLSILNGQIDHMSLMGR